MDLITRRQLFIGSVVGAGVELTWDVGVAGSANNADLPVADAPDFFYRPRGAWAGDFIPSYFEDEFHLFFLLDWRDPTKQAQGMSWYHVSTTDFIHFNEHGEALPHGTKLDQDLYVFTGSIIQARDGFHIFYTGHNDLLAKQGGRRQGVMHAVSQDLKTWRKVPKDTFYSPVDYFEKDDWRDPFVFWNPDRREYNMLLAARAKVGIPRRRGVTALCSSKDLVTWQLREPFYAPGLYRTHECPDLFKVGDWWYLIFSDDADRRRTRYRMGRSLEGPWITPVRDDLEGCAFYAGKSASDGKARFLFGWNPTRTGDKDDGAWNWGGNLVVHELIQRGDGALSVRVPQSVSKAFQQPLAIRPSEGSGGTQYRGGALMLDARKGYAASALGKQPRLCRITASASFDAETTELGLMFRTSGDLDNGYYIRLEPRSRRVVFDKWPRRLELSQMVELERPIDFPLGTPVLITVIIDGTMGVAYVNDEIAMSFRAYDLPEGGWGFFATGGLVTFSDISIGTLTDRRQQPT